jgi:hypothetical protein
VIALSIAVLLLGVAPLDAGFDASPDTGPAAATPPRNVLLSVGLVRVSPHRPGTDNPWDTVIDEPKTSDPCKFLSGLVTLASIPAGASVVARSVTESLCEHVHLNKQRVQAHPITDPDLLCGWLLRRPFHIGRTPLGIRSRTCLIFESSFQLTLSRLLGLTFTYKTMMKPGPDESQENIGAIRLTRTQLLDALRGNGLLSLDDLQGGLTRIDIAVAAEPGPRRTTQILNVAATHAVQWKDIKFNAGRY